MIVSVSVSASVRECVCDEVSHSKVFEAFEHAPLHPRLSQVEIIVRVILHRYVETRPRRWETQNDFYLHLGILNFDSQSFPNVE